jgi:hypothetical protein
MERRGSEGRIRSGACALSFRGWGDISTFYGPAKTLPQSYSSGPLCLGMRLSRVCRHHRLSREPTSPATPGSTCFSLWGYLLTFISLFLFFFFQVYGLFCSLSLEIKELQAAILAEAVSVPFPEACTALLGTTDLCSFVRVIPPFCVNYAVPASHLSPPQSDYF